MSAAQHTSEWILCDDPDGCTIRTNDENSELVCEFPYGLEGVSGDGEKYARLIASAPELLALAQYTVDNPEFDSAKFDAMARAALAKATGAA